MDVGPIIVFVGRHPGEGRTSVRREARRSVRPELRRHRQFRARHRGSDRDGADGGAAGSYQRQHHDAEAAAHRDPAHREEPADDGAGEPGPAPRQDGAGETGRDRGKETQGRVLWLFNVKNLYN